jgi:hypothetical protein
VTGLDPKEAALAEVAETAAAWRAALETFRQAVVKARGLGADSLEVAQRSGERRDIIRQILSGP